MQEEWRLIITPLRIPAVSRVGQPNDGDLARWQRHVEGWYQIYVEGM
jgi:hypothetical protein